MTSPQAPSPSHPLTSYGWNADLAAAFADHQAAGLQPARVVRVDRGHATAVTTTGTVRATTDQRAAPPCTGDWAALRPGPTPELAAVLPRRTAITRASAGARSHAQALAANVDTVAIAVSLAGRAAPGLVERLLALAWESGARPVIVLTKADLATTDPADTLAETADLAPGVDVLLTSTATGEGLDTLTAVLTGTVVLLGASGAGKSSLGNALLGADLLATGHVRAQDGRGRHTTVHRELLPLPTGGVLIDTPGLRSVGLQDTGDGIEQVFAEITQLARHCRFADCAHQTEPDCAVLAAVEDGALPERRLVSYRKLLRESAWAASRDDARLRARRTAERKAITRHLRATYEHRKPQI